MQMKSKIDKPTRKASAFAMLLALLLLSCLSFSPPLSMKSMAKPRLAKIAMKPIITMYVIQGIIA